MYKAFLGAGWQFPIVPDAAGRLTYSTAETNIEQSLKILLLTRLGERVMRPDFGSKAADFVFAPGSVQNLHLLETTVREAIVTWEPRVQLLDVTAEANPSSPERVLVSIQYLVRASNTRHSLVFPYYVLQVGRP